jgi:hypothetical protein
VRGLKGEKNTNKREPLFVKNLGEYEVRSTHLIHHHREKIEKQGKERKERKAIIGCHLQPFNHQEKGKKGGKRKGKGNTGERPLATRRDHTTNPYVDFREMALIAPYFSKASCLVSSETKRS